jgi:hypothetical protein
VEVTEEREKKEMPGPEAEAKLKGMIQAVEKSMGSLQTLKTSTMSVEGQRKIQTTLDECQGESFRFFRFFVFRPIYRPID